AGILHTGQGRGIACVDFNNDGKLDIFIANNGTGPTVYENESDNANHYLMIDLAGTGKNPDAIGARVTVISASGSQMQEVQLGTWYLSQGPQRLHFGLGEDNEVAAIEVIWPGPERATSRVENIAVDQVVEIEHP
ncbi:MAG: CRTAC1 family protein, partial [Gammaproteobacteria bacterium]|nr:CRTAC1 family protein [Gammaproteobacteria bacterium]